MSLDELNLDGGEGVGNAQEGASEKSEKQKDASRRAQSQLQKTQKDEKKAKGDNNDLFLILSRFIQNPYYEDLIPGVVLLLQNSYPSRFILAIISLVYADAAYYLIDKLEKNISKDTLLHLHHYTEPYTFEENTLHQSLRYWISTWMILTQEYLGHTEGSTILQQKTLHLLSGDARSIARGVIKDIFSFFLSTKNIIFEERKVLSYAEFILSEYEEVIRVHLENADIDLKNQKEIDTNTLFGL